MPAVRSYRPTGEDLALTRSISRGPCTGSASTAVFEGVVGAGGGGAAGEILAGLAMAGIREGRSGPLEV